MWSKAALAVAQANVMWYCKTKKAHDKIKSAFSFNKNETCEIQKKGQAKKIENLLTGIKVQTVETFTTHPVREAHLCIHLFLLISAENVHVYMSACEMDG